MKAWEHNEKSQTIADRKGDIVCRLYPGHEHSKRNRCIIENAPEMFDIVYRLKGLDREGDIQQFASDVYSCIADAKELYKTINNE